jgi:hypothetical protein
MKRVLFSSIIIFFIFLNSFCFASGAAIRADRTDVKTNETFNIIVSVENAKGSVSLPKIDGLKVLSSSTNSSIRIINGKREEKIIYTFNVLPVKEGKIVIPPFEVETNKGRFKTNSLEINVSKTDAGIPGKDNFFARAFISDSSPYVSEAVEFKIVIYSDESVLKIGFEEPGFKNFKAERQDDRTYSKIIGNKTYTVSEIVYSLYPYIITNGDIAPVRIEAQTGRKAARQNNPFFNDPFFSDPGFSTFQTSKKIIFTQALPYNIKELPKNSLNSFFSNIIGRISASADMDKKTISADDFINYRIRVKGIGNLSDIKLPEIYSTDDFKVYPDNPKFELKKSSKGEEGEVVFNYAIVPSKSGTFEIPALKFCFFDPEKEKWIDIEIEKKIFSVTGEIGKNHEKNENMEKKVIEKKEDKKIKKPIIRDDIIYLKEQKETMFSSVPDYSLFLKLYIATGFCFCLFLMFRKISPSVFSKNIRTVCLKKLGSIEKKNSEKKNIHELRFVLNNYFLEKYGETVETFISKTDDDEIKKYLSELEFAEFSGKNTDFDLKNLVLKGKNLIKRF